MTSTKRCLLIKTLEESKELQYMIHIKILRLETNFMIFHKELSDFIQNNQTVVIWAFL